MLDSVEYTAFGQQDIIILSAADLRAKKVKQVPFDWSAETYAVLDYSTIPDCREQLLTLLSE